VKQENESQKCGILAFRKELSQHCMEKIMKTKKTMGMRIEP
jgi:hypothetical protein